MSRLFSKSEPMTRIFSISGMIYSLLHRYHCWNSHKVRKYFRYSLIIKPVKASSLR